MDILELGQLFMTGVKGLSLSDDERAFIKDNNIGGVILFQENYQDPGQLAELINDIQTLRDEYPLFIAVDQEGGRVRRFKTNFTQFPSMLEIGNRNSPKLTFETHKIMGEELKSVGVNLNLSPCCDVFSNSNNKVIGDRSFGKDAETVEKNVSAAIRGLHTGGVLSCAKHFPGHGSTLKDSHFDLPYVKTPMEKLRKVELPPFVKAAKSRVEFIMMAHLVVDAIDPALPCTLSPKAYEFLRDELKYTKLIISDDMEMKAITNKYSYGEAASMALHAGVDILEYRSMEACREAFEFIRFNVKEKAIHKNIFPDKFLRIKSCKKEFLKNYSPVYIPSLSKVFSEGKHQEILDALAQDKK